MTELVGDVIIPSEIIVPQNVSGATLTKMSGANLFLSGAKIWFVNHDLYQIVTSV